MNTATYHSLPADVRADLGNSVRLDESIPTGTVRVHGAGGTTIQVSVNAFVRARRRVRKAERQNRKRGRR